MLPSDPGSPSHAVNTPHPDNSHVPGAHPHRHQRTWFEWGRRVFLAGILVIVPVTVAVYAVLLMMGVTEAIFGAAIEQLIMTLADAGYELGTGWTPLVKSIASLGLAVALIMIVGWLSTFLLIRRLIALGETVIARVPFVKFFYSVPKEVLNTFALQRKASFKRVVLVEYPRTGIWAIGFATGELEMRPGGRRLISVFVPTTPNPTSGFLMYFAPEEVLDTNLPIEEGARVIISGGILSPAAIDTAPFCGLYSQPKLPPLDIPEVVSDEDSDPVGGPEHRTMQSTPKN